ncbi:MAG TPA: non-homologous end-joining DNA ligase [Casimicrobiaceae bacterium]|nr:non-homologous end-joining DNA ligase [Casimicrobiaceae bacterium]
MKDSSEIVMAGDREVAISHPGKVLFPESGHTKLDLVRYYLAIAEGALRGAGGRPNMLVRFPDGIDAEFFYQKRAPASRPEWIEVVTIRFPSGRSADEVVPRDAAALAWMVNLGCVELHPHPVRAEDLDHPDELRIDLDPVPGVLWSQVRAVGKVVREVLDSLALEGYPKTSGKRGLHVYVRIEPRWTHDQVRRCALAIGREVERRAPKLATTQWWKEQRHGVFLDYNQNAKDRTIAGAYSVRPTPEATVSTPIEWSELGSCEPRDFTLKSVPPRFRGRDPYQRIDRKAFSLEALLELVAAQERDGLGDAPWPPHYRKGSDEPPRVQPSKRKYSLSGGAGRPRTRARARTAP